MHPSRWALLASGVMAAVALLLDFARADLTGDVVGWDASVWPAAAALVVGAALALLGDRREGFPAGGTVLLLLLAAAATLFAVAKLVDAAEAARIVRAAGGSSAVGPGAWLLVVAALVGLGGSVATFSRRVA